MRVSAEGTFEGKMTHRTALGNPGVKHCELKIVFKVQGVGKHKLGIYVLLKVFERIESHTESL